MEELYDAKCREGEVGNTLNESNSHEQLVYFSTRVSVAMHSTFSEGCQSYSGDCSLELTWKYSVMHDRPQMNRILHIGALFVLELSIKTHRPTRPLVFINVFSWAKGVQLLNSCVLLFHFYKFLLFLSSLYLRDKSPLEKNVIRLCLWNFLVSTITYFLFQRSLCKSKTLEVRPRNTLQNIIIHHHMSVSIKPVFRYMTGTLSRSFDWSFWFQSKLFTIYYYLRLWETKALLSSKNATWTIGKVWYAAQCRSLRKMNHIVYWLQIYPH